MRTLTLTLTLTLLGCGPKIERGPVPVEQAREPASWVLQLDPGAPSVYLMAMVAAGSAWDPVGREGTAWLTAQALASAGAGSRGPDEVRELLYLTGNRLEVIVDREWVTFRLRCHREQAETCGELFLDVLTAPLFDAAEVDRLREEALYALGDGLVANEEELAYEVLDAWLFEGHPYGHPARGREGVLPLLTVDELRRYHERTYVRQAITFGAGGAIDEALLGRLRARADALPGALPPELPLQRPAPVLGRSLLVVDTGSDVVGFRLGHPLPVTRDHGDWPALYTALTAFGAHRQSFGTLFRSLRGERGLNYGTYAYVEPFRERSGAALEENGILRRQPFFHLWIRPTSPENGPFALKLALAELEELVARGLDDQELSDIQAYLDGAIPLLARDPGRRLAYAVEAHATGLPDPLVSLRERVLALTAEDVRAALSEHLRPDALRIVAVGGHAEALVARLESGEPTPIVYTGLEPAEDQRARDAEIAARRLELSGAPRVVPSRGLFR